MLGSNGLVSPVCTNSGGVVGTPADASNRVGLWGWRKYSDFRDAFLYAASRLT